MPISSAGSKSSSSSSSSSSAGGGTSAAGGGKSTTSGSGSGTSGATASTTGGGGSSSSVGTKSESTPSVGKADGSSQARSTADSLDRTQTDTQDRVELSKEETDDSHESVIDLVDGLNSWASEDDKDTDTDSDTESRLGGENLKDAEEATENSLTGENVKDTGETAETTEAEAQEEAAKSLELNEGELLARFSDANPEKVTQLQEMLNDSGMEIAVDGKFGPETQEAVREYQRQNNLKVDGIVGPETQGSLNGGSINSTVSQDEVDQVREEAAQTAAPGQQGQIAPADPNMSPQEQYDYYKGIIEANGGEINADGPTVLGMRGLGTDGSYHNSADNVGGYNDTFVVLNQGPDGQPTVQTFQGATHANQYSSGASYGPDGSGRTIRGVAQLQPGTYDVNYATGDYGGYGAAYHVTTQNGSGYVPAYRDTNADGTISAAERAAAVSDGYTATSILFHNGKNAAPSSIGCQTIIPSQHSAFTQAVGRGGFSYTLIDANDAYMPM